MVSGSISIKFDVVVDAKKDFTKIKNDIEKAAQKIMNDYNGMGGNGEVYLDTDSEDIEIYKEEQ